MQMELKQRTEIAVVGFKESSLSMICTVSCSSLRSTFPAPHWGSFVCIDKICTLNVCHLEWPTFGHIAVYALADSLVAVIFKYSIAIFLVSMTTSTQTIWQKSFFNPRDPILFYCTGLHRGWGAHYFC